MNAILSPKQKMPDTSAQEARLAEQDAKADKEARDLAKKSAASRNARKRGGSRSLLSGAETGVARDTLS